MNLIFANMWYLHIYTLEDLQKKILKARNHSDEKTSNNSQNESVRQITDELELALLFGVSAPQACKLEFFAIPNPCRICALERALSNAFLLFPSN